MKEEGRNIGVNKSTQVENENRMRRQRLAEIVFLTINITLKQNVILYQISNKATFLYKSRSSWIL